MEWCSENKDNQKSLGFTLIELLSVLGILALLLNLALPGFTELRRNIRMDITSKEIVRLVHAARVSAITRGSLATICPSNDGINCTRNWHDGVLIFEDRDGDRRISSEADLVRYHQFPDFEGEIRWRAFQNRRYLQITPQGFTRYQNGNFTICPEDKDARFARQLIVNRVARIRHAKDSNGDGFREDSRGRPLRCS